MRIQDKIKSLQGDHLKARLLAISLSISLSILIMAVKFYVYSQTRSSAVLSDALESIINVVASAFAIGSILLAAQPPDRNHPYGHGKIEYFSAGFEGALIVLAAVGIFRVGWQHIFEPHPLPNLAQGMFLLLGAGVLNLFLGIGLVRVGKQTDSLTLVADGKHVLTDVYTSAGVVLGLFLVHLTGKHWLDGVVACLVGINILVTGSGLVRHAFARLMDASDPKLLKRVGNLILQHRKDTWIDIHQLRAWRSGSFIHIDLHLILPRDFSLDAAHREAKELEKIIVSYLGGKASVLIHMDPCINPDCAVCGERMCDLRKHTQKSHPFGDWTALTLHGGSGERLSRSLFRFRK